MIVIVMRFSKWLTATVSTEQSGWPVCTHARSQLDTLWKHVLATDVVVGWTWTYRLHRRLAEKKEPWDGLRKKNRFYCFLWYLTRKGSKTEERLKEEEERKREREKLAAAGHLKRLQDLVRVDQSGRSTWISHRQESNALAAYPWMVMCAWCVQGMVRWSILLAYLPLVCEMTSKVPLGTSLKTSCEQQVSKGKTHLLQ